VRYYQAEHEAAYRRIRQLGHTQWNDLFDPSGQWTFEDFQNRGFLERALSQLELPPPAESDVLEYGCGTGPAACFLAARGYRVDAIDLIPEAIAIARQLAAERGVQVAFSVRDMCDLSGEPVSKRYHLVLDSYCLQSIVTDEDRAAVFAAVRARLEPNGYYLISTAVHEPGRVDEPGFRYDPVTGIYYREISDRGVVDGEVEIEGRRYQPHRRHLTPAALRAELAAAGFRVLRHGPQPSDLVCVRSGTLR
jgi:SAM-dependent methyltransferase